MSQPPNKNPLKDRLNDDELDLSISNYKDRDLPVKEIALLKRATKLDLSNNKLTGLPKSFATLTHLVKLDLSCNLITELPSNFGELHRLRHLDLYNNQLSHLPLSFHQLASLRWLDLKNNELSPQLAEAAGECLNPRECEQCARRVVAFMARVKEHYDQERIRRQQHEKELMTAKLAAEEAEKERLRLEKKAKKEQKKLELKARRKIENLSAHPRDEPPLQTASPAKTVHENTKNSGKSTWSFLAKLNVLLLLTAIAMATGAIYIHAHGDVSRSGLRSAADKLATNLATLAALSRRQAGAGAESALLVLSRVSELGASAGDALVGRALAVYEWSGSQAADADRYLTQHYGPSWKAVKSTAAAAGESAGKVAWSVGQGVLTLGDWAARRGWDLARTGAAAAWEASGPLWDSAAEYGTAVKAGVLAGVARLRQDAGAALLQWSGSARDAAADALWTLQREAPGYAASGWAAACSAASYTYDALSGLVVSAHQEAPSYASRVAEQFNRLLAWVTKG